MKITQEVSQLINQVSGMLRPATENVQVERDHDGVKALISTEVSINHRHEMRKLVKKCKNPAEVNEKLGEYLAVYARNRKEVIDSIPVNLRSSKK